MLGLGVLFALPAPVFAQTAPPATASTAATPPVPTEAAVTPPAVQGSTDVPYPPGAQGDAVVVLPVDLERNGRVANAVVIEGTEPFAEQALDRRPAYAAERRGRGFFLNPR
jgi:hypothetical protein